MKMIVEQLVEWRLAGETEVLGENLPQCHFVNHKSHMTRPGLEPRAAAVGSQRLTAWAMARLLISCKSEVSHGTEYQDYGSFEIPEDVGIRFLLNVRTYLPNYLTSQPTAS
jgi:hypothetical protein